MQKITLPNPSKKRALFIIDIQIGFVNDHSSWIIPNVVKLIQDGDYELLVCAEFHADPNSQWDVQSGWMFPHSPTLPEIKNILDPEKTIFIQKESRSVFLKNPELEKVLRSKGIEEVHIVGYDLNDCVLTTANDAFDRGFFTYVIEECAESSQNIELRDAALLILRENEMTNHSDMIVEKEILEL